MTSPPRFSVDYLDFLLELLRSELPAGVKVMTRIPDHLPDHVPLVVIRRIGGDSPAPEFYDIPWINVQCWCAEDPVTGIDAFRAAGNLADAVRGVLWTAFRTQQVVPGKGWIGYIRESSAPEEVADTDLPFIGRYAATYELRVRPAPST